MKTVKLIAVIVMLLATVSVSAQNKKSKNQKVVVLSVSMHCEGCKEKIEKNISWEKGVKDLVVNLEKKTVTITYDAKKTNEDVLIKAIEKLDYKCEKIDPKEKKG